MALLPTACFWRPFLAHITHLTLPYSAYSLAAKPDIETCKCLDHQTQTVLQSKRNHKSKHNIMVNLQINMNGNYFGRKLEHKQPEQKISVFNDTVP